MRLASVAAASGLALILAACSGGGTAASGGAAVITLTEFKYAPVDLQAKAGQPLKLTVKNGGVVEHDFTIDRIGLKVLVQPGHSAEREIKALEPGTYEIYCSIPGHKDAGMRGKLIVGTPSAAQASEPSAAATAAPGQAAAEATTPANDPLALGKKVFETAGGVGCHACHGPDAKGRVTESFTAPNIRGATEQKFRDALSGGAAPMAFLKTQLSDQEKEAVIKYLDYLSKQ